MPIMMAMVPNMAMVHVIMHKRDLAAGIDGRQLRDRRRRCGEGKACRCDCSDEGVP